MILLSLDPFASILSTYPHSRPLIHTGVPQQADWPFTLRSFGVFDQVAHAGSATQPHRRPGRAFLRENGTRISEDIL
jgi:hypothetical protein